MAKYIFVTGGVISGIGKGIASSSIALILKSMGYKVTIKKLDPYLNVDPGTISPVQHGEVFVTNDGQECDMDLGHYERFTNIEMSSFNSITAGKIYEKLIQNERDGKYLGSTVQVIPHVTDLIKEFIMSKDKDYDIIICEIGGTVGDIEAMPFIEAARQIKLKMQNNSIFVHLTYIPYLGNVKELKTKPTQHSVSNLMSVGIVPNIIICRSEARLDKNSITKISQFCNVKEENVIEGNNVKIIYEVPLTYLKQGLDKKIARELGIKYIKPQVSEYEKRVAVAKDEAKKQITIMIAGKYSTTESYKSLNEAIEHSSYFNNVLVKMKWVNTKEFDHKEITKDMFEGIDGIIVPGGFGYEGAEGKIKIINYARINNIPLLGICLGLQLMIIEYARNVLKISDASSSEFKPNGKNNVIDLMTNFIKDGVKVKIDSNTQLGATMRLGSYEAKVMPKTLMSKIYDKKRVQERHRHRYEVNNKYVDRLINSGMTISAISTEKNLVEAVEVTSNKFFFSVQYHPELKSKFMDSHPIFNYLLKICAENKKS
jgi:CTP synthase